MGEVPREEYKTCKGCGRGVEETGFLSWTRLCSDCAETRYTENLLELAAREGKYYDHWKRRYFMKARQLLLDDKRPAA